MDYAVIPCGYVHVVYKHTIESDGMHVDILALEFEIGVPRGYVRTRQHDIAVVVTPDRQATLQPELAHSRGAQIVNVNQDSHLLLR
jgi:hypothetical protein